MFTLADYQHYTCSIIKSQPPRRDFSTDEVDSGLESPIKMKYSLTSGECYSPKSPQLVIFPPRFPQKSEPLNGHPTTGQVQFYNGYRAEMGVEREPNWPTRDYEHGVPNTPVPHPPYKRSDSGYAHALNASNGNIILQNSSLPRLKYERPQNLKIESTKSLPLRDSLKSARDNVCVKVETVPETGIDRQCVSRCSFYILIALTLLSIAFATGCGVIMLRLISKCDRLEQLLNSAQTSYAHAQQEAHMCLPCGELSQGPFEEDNVMLNGLFKKEEAGTEICCAKSAEQFSIMLNLFAKRKQKEKCAEETLVKENSTQAVCNNTTSSVAPPSRTNGTVSAHLVAGEQPQIDGDENDYQPIKNWLFQDQPGTHLTNIQMSDGSRLVVPETGNYFLYSQVGFLLYYDIAQNVDDAKQSLFHMVYRYNAIYPLGGSEELLRSEVTQCWEKQKDFGRYTSYVGASVRLNKGDQIYVKVSKIKSLSRTPQITYFGLFKLS